MSSELIKITVDESGKQLVSARDLYNIVLVQEGKNERFSQWFKRHLRYGFEDGVDFIQTVSYTAVNNGAKRRLDDYLMTIDMTKDLCRKQRGNHKAYQVLQYLMELDGVEVVIVEPQRKEIEFLDVLETQLRVFDVEDFERQYNNLQCGNYRIDLYIPSLNIAIEYDEDGHRGYSYEQQELRQQLIEEEIGCRFIRVGDDKSHIENSAIVIKELISIGVMGGRINE